MKLAGRARNAPIEETPRFAHVAEGFRRSGDLMRAVSLCQDGLRRFPDHVSGRVTLGWALLDLGRYEEAQQELQHALKRAPDNLLAIRGLAHLHEHVDGGEFHEGNDSDHAEEQRWFENAGSSSASDESSSEPDIDEEHADALAALGRLQREESPIVQSSPADTAISVGSGHIAGEPEQAEPEIDNLAGPESEFAGATHFEAAPEFDAPAPAAVADPATVADPAIDESVAKDGSVEQELLRLAAVLEAQADSGLDELPLATPSVAPNISAAPAPVAEAENVFSEPEISGFEPDVAEPALIHVPPRDAADPPVGPAAAEIVAGQLAIEDSGIEQFVPESTVPEPLAAQQSLAVDMAAVLDAPAGPSVALDVDHDVFASEDSADSTAGDLDSLLASAPLLEPVADVANGSGDFSLASEEIPSPSLDGVEPVPVAIGTDEYDLPSMPVIAALERFLTQVQNRRTALR
jgi:hypothetical protein